MKICRITSTVRHKKVVCSGYQGFAFVSPFEWLSHGAVEVVNKLKNAMPELVGTGETGAFE